MSPITTVAETVSTTPASPPPNPDGPWRRFAADGLGRLRAVLEKTDPADGPLRIFLVLVIDHSDSRAQALATDGEIPPPPPHLTGTLRNGLGEGRLRRDLALFFAEEVVDAFARLLAWKAGKTASEEERRRLEDLAGAQQRLLEAIRKIVLPDPSDAPIPDRR